MQTYIGHGGKVANKNPAIYIAKRGEDLALSVINARTIAGNQRMPPFRFTFRTLLTPGQDSKNPQIVLYVLPGRDSFMYERLKKNNECRFAMVSQMLNVAHVVQASPQYCSNVCMKLNAKLGGTSCKVADSRPPKPLFSCPTMIIGKTHNFKHWHLLTPLGADVSHPTPGSPQASMAAITMSFDRNACRYAAAVQTNGYRVEMITAANIKSMMIPLFDYWISKVGGGSGPKHIYYFRDGVSEGQYSHVLEREVKDMKSALVEKYGNAAASVSSQLSIPERANKATD